MLTSLPDSPKETLHVENIIPQIASFDTKILERVEENTDRIFYSNTLEHFGKFFIGLLNPQYIDARQTEVGHHVYLATRHSVSLNYAGGGGGEKA